MQAPSWDHMRACAPLEASGAADLPSCPECPFPAGSFPVGSMLDIPLISQCNTSILVMSFVQVASLQGDLAADMLAQVPS